MSTPNSRHTLGGLALAVALSLFGAELMAVSPEPFMYPHAGPVATTSAQGSSNDLSTLPQITFSVPYSFSNLDPSVREATISCSIGAHGGETRINLDLARNGTATVIARPGGGKAAMNVDYTRYSCGIKYISNGNGSAKPGPTAQTWARPALG